MPELSLQRHRVVDDQIIANTKLLFDFINRSLCSHTTHVKQCNLIGKFLGFLEMLSRHYDTPITLELLNQLPNILPDHGVQSRSRLIQYHYGAFARRDESESNTEATPHATTEVGGLLVTVLIQLDGFDQFVNSLGNGSLSLSQIAIEK